jgi:hypothetical protein
MSPVEKQQWQQALILYMEVEPYCFAIMPRLMVDLIGLDHLKSRVSTLTIIEWDQSQTLIDCRESPDP